MTSEILERLDNKHKAYLENRKSVLKKTNKPDDVKGEIRGYLKGLETCGIISQIEFKALYTYYTDTATSRDIRVVLNDEELNFIIWLAKRDGVSLGQELSQIFYTELGALMDLHDEERKQEQEGVLNELAKEQSTLSKSLKVWGDAIEERRTIN